MLEKSTAKALENTNSEYRGNTGNQTTQTDLVSVELPAKAPFTNKNYFTLQTGNATHEFLADGLGLQPGISQIASTPQTGIVYSFQPEGVTAGIKESHIITHTDSETGTKPVNSSQLSDSMAPSRTGSVSAPQEAQATPSKTRRRTRKSQSGETTESLNVQSNATPARSRRARTETILAIDGQRSVETREDKLQSDLLDLVESQKGRKILTGTIQGVERSADNPNLSFAVIYRGDFKVIIPADETVRAPDDYRGRPPGEVMYYLVTKRLGAEVDYIVKGVDVNSGIAAASRLDAMALKRRQYYFDSDRSGNNPISVGITAETRVVSVIRAGIFVDLFGLEVYIPLRELSYQRWIDASTHFQPGERVLVKILKIDCSDHNNIQVTASVKQAGSNPYEQALKRYTPGSRYVGTVSMVDTNGVFVSLDGDIDCLCAYPKRGRPSRGSMVTVRIIGVNHDTNRIWGAITHMTVIK